MAPRLPRLRTPKRQGPVHVSLVYSFMYDCLLIEYPVQKGRGSSTCHSFIRSNHIIYARPGAIIFHVSFVYLLDSYEEALASTVV